MGWNSWRSLPEGLRIREIAMEADPIAISMAITAGNGPCPLCDLPSDNVHLPCEHTLADLPWVGTTVILRVRVRLPFS